MPQDSGGLLLVLHPVKQCCVSEKFKEHTKPGFLQVQRVKRDHTAGDTHRNRSRSILLLSH